MKSPFVRRSKFEREVGFVRFANRQVDAVERENAAYESENARLRAENDEYVETIVGLRRELNAEREPKTQVSF